MASSKPDLAADDPTGLDGRCLARSMVGQSPDLPADPWAEVPAIRARIPVFAVPPRDHVVTDYGARGDGRTDDHAALQRTIAACAAGGGGRVVVPPGEYLTGPLHLESHVNLHLCAGATLRFVTDACRYLPPVRTRWEGVECMGLSPLVYACGREQVAITGGGILDGQAGPGRWWQWAGPWEGARATGWAPGQPHQATARRNLIAWAASGTPVAQRILTDADLLRPMFIEFFRCHDVLVEGITVRNAPMWAIHPVFSRAVTVRGVRVCSHGPNNDGCVADSCCDVLIEDCQFETGDDCIAIKSGRNEDGRRANRPAENVVIRRCRMQDGHGGVAIGSEISGCVRRVFVEQCVMGGSELAQAFRVKGNSLRGGVVEQIFLRDIEVREVREAAVRIDLLYAQAEEQGHLLPRVHTLVLERLTCARSGRAIWIEGLAVRPVRDVRISDSSFGHVDAPNILHCVEDLTLERVRFPAPA